MGQSFPLTIIDLTNIFQRGRSTTNQIYIYIYLYPIIVPLNHIKPPWKIPPSNIFPPRPIKVCHLGQAAVAAAPGFPKSGRFLGRLGWLNQQRYQRKMGKIFIDMV